MCTDVTACDCTWGCMDTIRESALKVDSGRKNPCRIRESNLCQWHASLMLYQLSYIPTPTQAVGSDHKNGVELTCVHSTDDPGQAGNLPDRLGAEVKDH